MEKTKFATTAFALGKAWRLGRRSLSPDVKKAFVELLLVMKPHFAPVAGAPSVVLDSATRADIPELMNLSAKLATFEAPKVAHIVAARDDPGVPVCVEDPLLALADEMIGTDGDGLDSRAAALGAAADGMPQAAVQRQPRAADV